MLILFRYLQVLSTLKILPIPNKNHLVDSKILPLVEKWSRLHDSPDSIRSDEEGSSSENEAAAAAAAAAKAASTESEKDTKSEKAELDKSTKEERRKCSSDVKSASTDDESDNSEKYEEVGSMANELLNHWKGLRVSFWFCCFREYESLGGIIQSFRMIQKSYFMHMRK